MNLALAQVDRHQRGELLAQQRASALADELCDAVELLSNAARVGPAARSKLKNLIAFYRKKPHPFTACVSDNTKRFGPEGAKKVCAVLKDIMVGNTKWRKGRKGMAVHASQDEVIEPSPEIDAELFSLLHSISRTDYKQILGLES